MSDAYHQLLEATIEHLEMLKERGERYVSVSPATLQALTQPLSAPAAATQAPKTPSRATPAQRQAELTSPRSSTAVEAATAAAPVSTPMPAATPLSGQARISAFEALRDRALACTRCPNLVTARKTVVFGVGSPEAELMFVGEAPGADEDRQGEPFVGAAGQLLTRIIVAMGLTRETVYIANILKCRPDTPGQASGNRKPTAEEMKTCIPYLHEQIDLIRPRVLVALGATAVEGLLGSTTGITRLRGHWQTYRGIPLMPTYHPAYLLRNQAMSEKRRVWEDMLQVMEKLSLPISARQRGYFLNKA